MFLRRLSNSSLTDAKHAVYISHLHNNVHEYNNAYQYTVRLVLTHKLYTFLSNRIYIDSEISPFILSQIMLISYENAHGSIEYMIPILYYVAMCQIYEQKFYPG